MKVLVVDDELPARNRIISLLESKSEITEIKEASSGQTALEILSHYKPSIIFLDINLNDMLAFEMLDKVEFEVKPALIFVSAFDSYGVEAFNYKAQDFLLKPFKDERFEESYRYILEQTEAQKSKVFQDKLEKLLNLQSSKKAVKNLPVTLGNKTIFVQTKDLKYILADRYYIELYTSSNKYVMRQSLTNLVDMLDEENFIRIHRSTIVAKQYIQEIIHSDYSEIDIKMTDGKLFRVSRSKKKEVFCFLGLG